MSEKWLTRFCWILLAITIPLYALKVAKKADYTDFSVYHRAAERVSAERWNEVYNLADGASPYRYAPVTLPFFEPFAALSPVTARVTWYFLQVLWFGLGFLVLHRALRLSRKSRAVALPATLLALLFVFRFCLDTFTIGQVSSLMFLGFAVGLWGWMQGRTVGLLASGFGLFVPTIFKIGPGVSLALMGLGRPRERWLPWLAALLPVLALVGLLGLWLTLKGAPDGTFVELWKGWSVIVSQDSSYYDASHYGSQSIKSFLLRLAVGRTIPFGWVAPIWMAISALAVAAVAGFWLLRRARSRRGRGLFFCLGIFLYLWLMPETFKYGLTTLAFPVALLLVPVLTGRNRSRLTLAALGFGALVLSLAGKDLLPNWLFFGLQRASVPLFATFLIALAVLKEAVKESAPSSLARRLGRMLEGLGKRSIAPWEVSPGRPTGGAVTVLFPLPLYGWDPEHGTRVEYLLKDMRSYIKEAQEPHEVLVLPYGDRISPTHPLALALAKVLPPGFSLVWSDASTRAAALRVGFLRSTGARILALNFDQPIESDFLRHATELLASSQVHLVRGNRRDPLTRFRVPVRLLSLVYGRHRLGLIFNRWVRFWLPLSTTDTHSGTWGMSRELALRVFSLQSTTGFLFDLEISLIAESLGYPSRDLPVTLYLAQEKPFQRVAVESFSILLGLPVLARRFRKGCYGPRVPLLEAQISADDWGISPGVNQGILRLARDGIVRRVSLMSDCRYLSQGLDDLKATPGVELGLHFNLTYGKRSSSPGRVLLEWMTSPRQPLIAEARRELRLQLEKLREAGVRPTYLDGHHHIHLVPGLLNSIADILKEAGIQEVRLPTHPAIWFSTRFPLALLSWRARPVLKRHGFRFHPFYYPALGEFRDVGRFAALLQKLGRCEVIVHPAESENSAHWEHPDPYIEPRVTEYRALRMLPFALGLERTSR